MPLFAWGIARSFFYVEQKGSLINYSKRMLWFSVVSQIPYTIMSYWCMGELKLNIGFTWLLSIVLMKTLSSDALLRKTLLMCTLTFLLALFTPIEYGLYGVLMPYVYYAFMYKRCKPEFAFLGTVILFALDAILRHDLIQVFSIISFPLLLLLKKYEDTIRLPRRFFYWFYPVHISIFLIIKLFMTI